ncbi:hypothetical protein FGO68_gene632 [Halteria grandinella]|uniref:Gamma-glutamylcyclotransferase family protein n=1 Tax=Halteria grandinella TaxID=5974 RepID=A0A8J8SY56_HALGN|nr:hypothetical protein FGO68_gene632 [Halteria grandinella]
MEHNRLFCLGTLMQGFQNHNKLGIKDQKFLGRAETIALGSMFCNIITKVSFRYEPKYIIKGEIYEIDPVLMGELDAFEQAEGYEREEIVVKKVESGEIIKVFVYTYNHMTPELRETMAEEISGDFREYAKGESEENRAKLYQ